MAYGLTIFRLKRHLSVGEILCGAAARKRISIIGLNLDTILPAQFAVLMGTVGFGRA